MRVPPGPVRQVDPLGELGHLGFVSRFQVPVHGLHPGRFSQLAYGQTDLLVHLEAEREFDPPVPQRLDEDVAGPAESGPHEHGHATLGVLPVGLDRQLGQG
jgi:hypothetical protein